VEHLIVLVLALKKLAKAKHSSLFGRFAIDGEVKKPGTKFTTLKFLRNLGISPIS
jgi:hypothetical protein